jgi:hypothetical protein
MHAAFARGEIVRQAESVSPNPQVLAALGPQAWVARCIFVSDFEALTYGNIFFVTDSLVN